VYLSESISILLDQIASSAVPVMKFIRRDNLYAFQHEVSAKVSMFLCSIKYPSLYNHVHKVTGHGGKLNQQWHRMQ
jgi:hypothetical protein